MSANPCFTNDRLQHTLQCAETVSSQAATTIDLGLKQTLLKAGCDLLDVSLRRHQQLDRLEQRPA
ncbi:MAG: hypothetical protein R3C01_10200 [Planctomycetaceae bacterium]